MRSAKVIVTDVGGKGKKIFHYGDVVTENSFPVGNFDRLIAGGFLKESEGKVEVPAEIEIIEAVQEEPVTFVTAPNETSEEIESAEETANEETSEEISDDISEVIEPQQNAHKNKKNKLKK